MVPADAKIIKIEKALRIDPEAQLLASIIAKKLSVGSKYIIIDIPYGKTAKIKTRKKALILKKKFEYLGGYFHRKIKIILTDGTQPIGNGIGPALEMIDIIKVLDPKQQGPQDLENKSLLIAGHLLEMTGLAEKKKGVLMAMDILDSGKAYKKFKEIIKAQKGDLSRLRCGKFSRNIMAKRRGKISEIDNKKINLLARVAGSPLNKFSGLYLHHHLREEVRKGEKILTIYSDSRSKLAEAVRFYKAAKPIKIK
jgi:thymidine phosphorylase